MKKERDLTIADFLEAVGGRVVGCLDDPSPAQLADAKREREKREWATKFLENWEIFDNSEIQ